MTLCPSAPLPPPPPPTLSSNVSAAQVVFVAVPRATRTMQRFVIGEKYFTVVPRQQKKKRIESSRSEKRRRRRKRDLSPASDAPTSPQPTSPKFKSTLCFSALKTSLLDIVSGDGAVMRWIWLCPGVETDGGGDAAGMNSMRSQRFCLRAC
jgi:hypothetical protein